MATKSIAEIQNATRSIELLAAQRLLYSRAKMVYAISILASISGALIFVPLGLMCAEVKPWGALYAIAVAIVEILLLDPAIKGLQRRAADVQEIFDHEVLGVPLHPVRHPALATEELVHSMAKRHLGGRRGANAKLSLQQWYPMNVQNVPMPIARFACQRGNLYWDSDLRGKYALGLLAALIILALGTVAGALGSKLGVSNALLVIVAPVLPALVWLARERRKQQDSAVSGDSARSRVDAILAEAIKNPIDDESSLALARAIQDEIYLRRRSDPLVFDWVFKSQRRRQETEASAAIARFEKAASSPTSASFSGPATSSVTIPS